MKVFLVTFLISSFAFADRPLTEIKSGHLKATVEKAEVLENLSATQGWLMNHKVYPHSFDADAAIARRKIVCSFTIPSGKMKNKEYLQYYAEYYEFNAHHIEFNSTAVEVNFFGLTCFKNEKLPVMTLEDLNQAFLGLIVFEELPASEIVK